MGNMKLTGTTSPSTRAANQLFEGPLSTALNKKNRWRIRHSRKLATPMRHCIWMARRTRCMTTGWNSRTILRPLDRQGRQGRHPIATLG